MKPRLPGESTRQRTVVILKHYHASFCENLMRFRPWKY